MRELGRPALIVGMAVMATACGKKGALIYPDLLAPAAASAVSAMQSGALVKLQFALPGKDRGGRPVQNIVGAKISRRATETAQKNVCRSCMSDYLLFRTLYLDHLTADSQRFGNRLIFSDNEVSAGNTYSYSIVPFTLDGIEGALSLTADVAIIPPLPAPGLTIESFPTEIKLLLRSQPPIDGQLLGYNLYRTSAAEQKSYQPLTSEPVKGNEYLDTSLERSVKYHYSARTVIMLPAGSLVESAESVEVEGMLKDGE